MDLLITKTPSSNTVSKNVISSTWFSKHELVVDMVGTLADIYDIFKHFWRHLNHYVNRN